MNGGALRLERWRCTRTYLVALLVASVFFRCAVVAAEPLPPKPPRFFNDYAGVVSARTAEELNARLASFERETSNQIIVAVFKTLPGDYALEDFTQRTAEAWGVGQKKTDNGAVLFVFTEARKMRIEVGYGLEAVLPDALAKQIIDNEIRPGFRTGDYASGLTRGVDAILRATRGEYKGDGRTNTDRSGQGGGSSLIVILFIVVFVLMFFNASRARRRGTFYSPAGRFSTGGWSIWPIGGGFGGGGFGGGGLVEGVVAGIVEGSPVVAGSFGGGGASGDW